jgi:NADPH:quinone reductase-like Zn-dependent oxidoreductase
MAEENAMRAIIQGYYGPPDDVLQLEDVDKPVADDYEVLVRFTQGSAVHRVVHLYRWGRRTSETRRRRRDRGG